MIRVSATTNLECAHRDDRGQMHGHSYEVEVFVPRGVDLGELDTRIAQVAGRIDHTVLEESIGGNRMEDIVTWFLAEIPDAVRVIVRRPTLGFSADGDRFGT